MQIKTLNSSKFEKVLEDCIISEKHPLFSFHRDTTFGKEFEVGQYLIRCDRFVGEDYSFISKKYIPLISMFIACYPRDKKEMVEMFDILVYNDKPILIDWIQKIKLLNGSYNF